MKLIASIFSAKFWLTVAVSLSIAMGASAEEIHLPTADDVNCEEAIQLDRHSVDNDSSIEQDDNNTPDREHDHHAHNCGACHLHPVHLKATAPNHEASLTQAHAIGADQTVPRAGPYGLYRPPRA